MQLQPLGDVAITEYRISTMTVTGNINSVIDLETFYNFIEIDKYESIRYVEYGTKELQSFKGVRVSKTKKKDKPLGKRFNNQLTLHMSDGLALYNVKLFKNGKIQMTGVKDCDGAQRIIDELIKIIKIGNLSCPNIVSDESSLENSGLSTRLINCDFRVNYKIDRPKFHRLLVTKYNLNCTYEPCIYQGVKVSYFFNKDTPGGRCKCAVRCSGKGPKTICKKVTIAAFQSGCVTITGALTIDHVNYVYELFSEILKKEAQTIHQPVYIEAASEIQ